MSEKTVLKKKDAEKTDLNPAAGALPAYVRGIDAESLYFFLTLYRAGSLPRAAEQMGVSLSSANRMLAKLRTYWNDPLFTRSGFLMQPTESAKKRYARVLGLMNTLEDLQHRGAPDRSAASEAHRAARDVRQRFYAWDRVRFRGV